MNTRIINRNSTPPEDGWYQIEVTGTHPAGTGRRQVIDDTALRAIVNRFRTEKSAKMAVRKRSVAKEESERCMHCYAEWLARRERVENLKTLSTFAPRSLPQRPAPR